MSTLHRSRRVDPRHRRCQPHRPLRTHHGDHEGSADPPDRRRRLTPGKAGRFWSRLFPNPRYYGWAVVGIGFLASALTSPGQSFAISLYLEPVMGELALSRMQVSSLYALAALGAAACLAFLGGVADRVPTGRFLATIMVAIGVTLIGFSSVKTAFAPWLVLFALRLLGQGAVGLGTLTATVRWFRQYRGRALAIVGLGYAFGQLLFPGIILGSIDWWGWRGSLLALA